MVRLEEDELSIEHQRYLEDILCYGVLEDTQADRTELNDDEVFVDL